MASMPSPSAFTPAHAVLSSFDAATAASIIADAVPGTVRDARVVHERSPEDGTIIVHLFGKLPDGSYASEDRRSEEEEKEEEANGTVGFFAAAPFERRNAPTASGIPFVDAKQAFDATLNRGVARVNGQGEFAVRLVQPNAYYAGLGTRYIPPTVHLVYARRGRKEHVALQVAEGVPFRMLTYPSLPTRPRRDATFYAGVRAVPPRTQERILRDSAYPADTMRMPPNFWGLRPPA